MRVYNKTRKLEITPNAREATNILHHFLGLRFRRKAHALLFTFRWKQKMLFDMWFVNFPIDVVYISDNTVVDLKENFKPWRMYRNKIAANKVLELPAGEISKKKIKKGDSIVLSPN